MAMGPTKNIRRWQILKVIGPFMRIFGGAPQWAIEQTRQRHMYPYPALSATFNIFLGFSVFLFVFFSKCVLPAVLSGLRRFPGF